MKKIIIVLFLFTLLLSPVYAQIPQVGLTAEAKIALIVKLEAKLSDLMNQLILLKAQLPQQQKTNPQLITCNGKSWLPCPTGKNFFCPSAGNAQCLIDSPYAQTPIPNTQTQSLVASPNQMAKIKQICLISPLLCKAPDFLSRYYSDAKFRVSTDKSIAQYIATGEDPYGYFGGDLRVDFEQKTKQADCLTNTDDLRGLSPQQITNILEHRCGTATPNSDLNYKLYQQQQYQECLIKQIGSSLPISCEYLKPVFY
ncbi:MAG: hypothetical protein V1704_02405 [Candidatus Vogelbacteria bacterium]